MELVGDLQDTPSLQLPSHISMIRLQVGIVVNSGGDQCMINDIQRDWYRNQTQRNRSAVSSGVVIDKNLMHRTLELGYLQ